LHLLGVVWTQSGDHQRAAALIKLSLQASPAQPAVWASLGNVQLSEQQYGAALESFDRCIALQPDYAPAHNGRGSSLFALGRSQESLQSFDRALELVPRFAEALGNKGLVLLSQQRHEAAAETLSAALDLAPGNGQLLTKRAVAECAMQRYEETIADCDRAVLAGGESADLKFLRSSALLGLGRAREALAALACNLSITPTPDLLTVQGSALRQLGRAAEAVACYEQALALRADHPAALRGLGTALTEARHLDRAAASFSRLLEVAPDGEFHRGLCLHAQLQVFDWHDYACQVPLILAGVGRGERVDLPLTFLSLSDDAALQRRCAEGYIGAFRRGLPALHARASARGERIRVAYLSSDFLEHPIAYLMAGVFEAHDRSRFEIIAIALRREPASPTARRLEHAFDRFIDASLHSDEGVAALITAAAIDIVVDLMGYTSQERPEILLRRPAPIQVNYLGMPATMGSPHIDYIVADEFVIPPQTAPYYSERIAYLPRCFQANDAGRAEAGPAVTRTQLGLPEAGFVWACFCASAKINPLLFDVWMRLLHGVPGSILWMVAGSPGAQANLRREAETRGVDSDRLVLAGRESYPGHLARLRLADLCLDTWPFNGGATSSDALWSGVPIITRVGAAFASRMSGSLLRAVGLPELVTSNLQDYERVALGLATDRHALERARARLNTARNGPGPFDTAALTREIEAAFAMMYERHASGADSATFRVAQEPA
jgi:protein O-GlcNAc transferase